MHYRLKISGCYSDIECFLEEFGAGGFDAFRASASLYEHESEGIEQISFAKGVMRLIRLNMNECIVSGVIRNANLNCDWIALKGMSEKYYTMTFEVRCVSNERQETFGVLVRNGDFSNRFLFRGIGDLVNAFFNYMCMVKFASSERARILNGSNVIGTYRLINKKTCMVTGSVHSTFLFSLGDGVEIELKYQESKDMQRKSFNAFLVDSRASSGKISDLILDFFLSNVKFSTLCNMSCNRLMQTRGI